MISEQSMQEAEHWFCLPVVMLINFSLFQYLVVLYYRRRSEVRIALLLGCAFLGFATIIPQAHPRDEMVSHLNDVSETCSTLTFLLQITVLGRDIERKVKIASLKVVTFFAELLTLVSLLVVVLNFLQIVAPSVDTSAFDGIDNVVENASLFYVFFSRFFYIAMSRGIKWTVANKKLEIFLYVLFMTHEYPFLGLEAATGVSWEPVQAIWHRLTLMMCILMTIKEKFSSKRGKSRDGQSTHAASRAGPSLANARTVGGQEDDDDDDNGGRKSSVVTTIKDKVKAKAASLSSTAPTATSGSRFSSMTRGGLFPVQGFSLSRSVRSVPSNGRSNRVMAVTPTQGPPKQLE